MQVGGLKTERLFDKDAGAGAGGGTSSEADANASVVTMTDKQLEAKINEVYARASKKTKAEMEENIIKPLQEKLEKFDTFSTQFDEFIKKNGNGSGASKGDGTESSKGKEGLEAEPILPEQLQQILTRKDEEWKAKFDAETKQKAELQNQLGQRIQESKRQALEVSAAKFGAIEPAEVAELLMKHIEVDKATSKFQVVGANGAKEFDNNGEPLSVEAFVQGYLNKRPHQVKADFRAGSGASGGVTGNGQGPNLQQKLAEAKKNKDWMAVVQIEQAIKQEGLKRK